MKNNLKYIFIITALTAVIYANSLHNDFLSDDLPAIVNNPDIAHPFAELNISGFSNSINYLIGGLDPFGYHLVNILLHAVNSIMVFFLLRLFFKSMPSLWGALIFAAHPAQTEAAAWVSGRPYLLYTFLLLCSFFFYLSASREGKLKPAKYIISLVFYLFALLASFFPLAFPALLAIYDFTFERWRRVWKLWLLFFLLAGVKVFMMPGLVEKRVAEIALDIGVRQWSNPFFNTVYSFFAHLWLLLWPARLTIYHEPAVISSRALTAEIILFALLIFCLPLFYKRAKPVFFALCLYMLFLWPTYSPMMVAWLVAERYLYFGCIAFSIIAAFLIDRYLSGSKIRIPAGIILAILIAAYAARSVIRNFDWRTHSSLWKATVKVSAQSPKAHNNMGDVYSLEGNMERAAAEFLRAIELKPDYAEAYHNMATIYLKMGRVDEAVMGYQQALAFKPGLYQSGVNLGYIYLQKGERKLARQHLERAAQLAPGNKDIKELLKQAQ